MDTCKNKEICTLNDAYVNQSEMLMAKVIADGVTGILYSIDYKNKTAVVEMDYRYLVEYPWSEVIV